MQSINVTTRQSLAEMLGVSMVSGNRIINDPFSGVSTTGRPAMPLKSRHTMRLRASQRAAELLIAWAAPGRVLSVTRVLRIKLK